MGTEYYPIVTGGVHRQSHVTDRAPLGVYGTFGQSVRVELADNDETVVRPVERGWHVSVVVLRHVDLDGRVDEPVRGVLGVAADELVPGEPHGRREVEDDRVAL